MEKFTIEKYGNSKYAVFNDGTRMKKVLYSPIYGEFFYVDNKISSGDQNIPSYSFYGRIKDALDTLKMGEGDYILTDKKDPYDNYVIYMLDRKKADGLRKALINTLSLPAYNFRWSIIYKPIKPPKQKHFRQDGYNILKYKDSKQENVYLNEYVDAEAIVKTIRKISKEYNKALEVVGKIDLDSSDIITKLNDVVKGINYTPYSNDIILKAAYSKSKHEKFDIKIIQVLTY